MSTVRDAGPPPVATWPEQACLGTDTRVFFPGNEGGGRNRVLEAMAKRICRRCPALEACKAYALPIKDLGGIWAGLNENERMHMRKARKQLAGGVA
jgi:WhiB family redox-sensing transcriptional regulator